MAGAPGQWEEGTHLVSDLFGLECGEFLENLVFLCCGHLVRKHCVDFLQERPQEQGVN